MVRQPKISGHFYRNNLWALRGFTNICFWGGICRGGSNIFCCCGSRVMDMWKRTASTWKIGRSLATFSTTNMVSPHKLQNHSVTLETYRLKTVCCLRDKLHFPYSFAQKPECGGTAGPPTFVAWAKPQPLVQTASFIDIKKCWALWFWRESQQDLGQHLNIVNSDTLTKSSTSMCQLWERMGYLYTMYIHIHIHIPTGGGWCTGGGTIQTHSHGRGGAWECWQMPTSNGVLSFARFQQNKCQVPLGIPCARFE